MTGYAPLQFQRAEPCEVPQNEIDFEVMTLVAPKPIEPDRGAGVSFPGVDIIQFGAPLCMVAASEGYVAIDVIRIGSLQDWASVKWRTEDGSAKAQDHYTYSSGKLEFATGVNLITVRVPLLSCRVWHACLEFKVVLSDPSEKCELGLYLQAARVKLIDDDIFPSQKHRAMIEDPAFGVDAVPGWSLMWEYFKLNFRTEGVAWRTILTLLCDQIENVFLFCTLSLNIYLVDVVLDKKDPTTEARLLVPSRATTALILGVLYLLPQVFHHMWEYSRIMLGTAGRTRAYLQANLFRIFMTYTDDSRHHANSIENAIVDSASQLAGSYMIALSFVKEAGRLMVMVVFVIRVNTQAWWAVLLMPSVMILFALLDPEDINGAARDILDKKNELSTMVIELQQKYELIADYYQRPLMNHMFWIELVSLNQKLSWESRIVLNYMMVPLHMAAFLTSFWIAWRSLAVLNDEVSLGTFLAMLNIFQRMAKEFGSLYAMGLDMKQSTAALRTVTEYLNLTTEMPFMLKVSRWRRALERAQEERALAAAKGTDFWRPVVDVLPIEMRNVSFTFGSSKNIFTNVSVSANQSSLIAIEAGHGAGRHTLLRLLSFKIFPDSGVIAIPSHLRILHVGQDPILLNLPAWENLTLACPDESPARVFSILEICGLASVSKLLEKDLRERKPHIDGRSDMFCGASEEGGMWQKRLSRSETAKIHFARAFLMNPEVMLLLHPFKHLDEAMDAKFFGLIRQHIDGRGMGMPSASLGRRRPRTVFFASDESQHINQGDLIWSIVGDGSVTMRLPSKINGHVQHQSCFAYDGWLLSRTNC